MPHLTRTEEAAKQTGLLQHQASLLLQAAGQLCSTSATLHASQPVSYLGAPVRSVGARAQPKMRGLKCTTSSTGAVPLQHVATARLPGAHLCQSGWAQRLWSCCKDGQHDGVQSLHVCVLCIQQRLQALQVLLPGCQQLLCLCRAQLQRALQPAEATVTMLAGQSKRLQQVNVATRRTSTFSQCEVGTVSVMGPPAASRRALCRRSMAAGLTAATHSVKPSAWPKVPSKAASASGCEAVWSCAERRSTKSCRPVQSSGCACFGCRQQQLSCLPQQTVQSR